MINHMVEHQTSRMDAVFHALGDATRRQMLQELAAGEQTVGKLAEPFAMSLAAASKHVKALETAGLIRREVRGRTHVCRLEAQPLADAHRWLATYERFWSGRLDVLEGLLRESDDAKPAKEHAHERSDISRRLRHPHHPHDAPHRTPSAGPVERCGATSPTGSCDAAGWRQATCTRRANPWNWSGATTN